jgi:hypothetical protein
MADAASLWSFGPERRKKRSPKTNVDVDSDVDAIDELNQNAGVNLLVHFQAIPLQRAF